MNHDRALSLKLWVVANRAMRSLEEHLRRQVEGHGISFTEFGVLEVLLHKGRMPIGEIGDRVLLSSGSMTYVVDKLERRGLIRRETSEADRRVIVIELSDEGSTLIRAVFEEHAALIHELLGPLSEAEKTQLIEGLKRVGLQARGAVSAVADVA